MCATHWLSAISHISATSCVVNLESALTIQVLEKVFILLVTLYYLLHVYSCFLVYACTGTTIHVHTSEFKRHLVALSMCEDDVIFEYVIHM